MASFSNAFLVAIKRVLKAEGLYVNNPNDPGGETKYGICKRQYPKEDIKNLTEARAMEIYYKDYWAPYFYDSVGAHLAEKVFDTAVNIGPKNAFKLLQESVNKLGGNLTVDGSIGPKSIEAINKFDEMKIIEQYRQLQASYYRNLCVKNKKLEVFLKGWLNRAAK